MWKFATIYSLTPLQYKEIYQTLPPIRKAHVDRMQKEEDKHRSLLASFLVGELLGVFPSPLENHQNGAPFLLNSSQYVSVAHSGAGVVCGVSNQPIGVDIESIVPFNPNLIPHFCTPNEQEYILQATQKEQQKRFFQVWGAKEAYIKYKGQPTLNFSSINTLDLPVQTLEQDGFLITLLEEPTT